MQSLGQFPVIAVRQFRESCMFQRLPVQRVMNDFFPGLLRGGEGGAVLHMLAQIQIVEKDFFQSGDLTVRFILYRRHIGAYLPACASLP